MDCEHCLYYAYDEDWDEYLCTAAMDEDEYARWQEQAGCRGRERDCPCYRPGDEYTIVRRQN